jgi:hypothetical protein
MNIKMCLRCGQDSELSNIGAALKNFVCDTCRHDKNGWEFNGVRLKDMEYESAIPDSVIEQWAEIKNKKQYQQSPERLNG